PGQIADPVVVAVLKRTRIDLIDHRTTPPVAIDRQRLDPGNMLVECNHVRTSFAARAQLCRGCRPSQPGARGYGQTTGIFLWQYRHCVRAWVRRQMAARAVKRAAASRPLPPGSARRGAVPPA